MGKLRDKLQPSGLSHAKSETAHLVGALQTVVKRFGGQIVPNQYDV